jgi:hypothetical protein
VADSSVAASGGDGLLVDRLANVFDGTVVFDLANFLEGILADFFGNLLDGILAMLCFQSVGRQFTETERFGLLESFHLTRRLACIKAFTIKRAVPLNQFFVLFVTGISQGFKVLSLAHESADILWWAGTSTFQTERVFRFFVDGWISLKQEIVSPAISKVVLVHPAEPFARLRQKLTQNNFILVTHLRAEIIH